MRVRVYLRKTGNMMCPRCGAYMRDVLILVLFAFSLGGLSLKPPAIKTVSALLIIVILGYWIIVYLIPIILCAIFLVLLGPLGMLSRLRKK